LGFISGKESPIIKCSYHQGKDKIISAKKIPTVLVGILV
jgi:hypothetical protein